MQGATARAARDAFMEIKTIAAEGIAFTYADGRERRMAEALRRVIQTADANARMLDEVSREAAPGEREGGHIQNT